MKKLLLIALMVSGLAFVPVQRSDAQVSVGLISQSPPGNWFVVKRNGGGVFFFQLFRFLPFIPFTLRGQHRRTENVEEAMHFRFYFVTKLPDRMMQSCGKLDRHALFCRSDKGASYLG